jgi:hypothetical protein
MPQFMIEVPHSKEAQACAREVHVFLSTGSHFLSNANWGCMDGVHCAWLVVDVPSKEDARMLLPPVFRAEARIVGLNKFNLEQIEAMIAEHN